MVERYLRTFFFIFEFLLLIFLIPMRKYFSRWTPEARNSGDYFIGSYTKVPPMETNEEGKCTAKCAGRKIRKRRKMIFVVLPPHFLALPQWHQKG